LWFLGGEFVVDCVVKMVADGRFLGVGKYASFFDFFENVLGLRSGWNSRGQAPSFLRARERLLERICLGLE
jgi:hypothetical protein